MIFALKACWLINCASWGLQTIDARHGKKSQMTSEGVVELVAPRCGLKRGFTLHITTWDQVGNAIAKSKTLRATTYLVWEKCLWMWEKVEIILLFICTVPNDTLVHQKHLLSLQRIKSEATKATLNKWKNSVATCTACMDLMQIVGRRVSTSTVLIIFSGSGRYCSVDFYCVIRRSQGQNRELRVK